MKERKSTDKCKVIEKASETEGELQKERERKGKREKEKECIVYEW